MKKIISLIILPALAFCATQVLQTSHLNLKQEQVLKFILSPYGDCISVESEKSDNFKNGVSLALREKHTPNCWEGKGDPNTSPVFKRIEIDRFGRVYEVGFDGVLSPVLGINDEVRNVKNISKWSHPVKKVFKKYGVKLLGVKLLMDKTLPIFYVADHELFNEHKNNMREKLFKELLKANGRWDFVMMIKDGKQYFIEGEKRKIPDLEGFKIR